MAGMTEHTDSTEHVPGQLDVYGRAAWTVAGDRWTPEERAELERELAEVREQGERLDMALLEYRTRALDKVRTATATAKDAADQLDAAVAEARGTDATWEQIGAAAGMTRQSAWKRWGA
jgi:hypothetical protein